MTPEINGLTISLINRVKYLINSENYVQLIIPDYETKEQYEILENLRCKQLTIELLKTKELKQLKKGTKYGKVIKRKALQNMDSYINDFGTNYLIVDNPYLFVLFSKYKFNCRFFKKNNIKYFCIAHSNLTLFAKKVNKRLIAFMLGFIIPNTCNKFISTIFPSMYVKDSFPKIKNGIVIPFLGVNKKIFFKIPANKPYNTIISVSRLSKEKGIDFLYEVSHAVTQKYNTKWIFIGTGPLEGKYDNTERISFLGEIGHGALPQYYNNATIFVSACDFEAFGLTIAEAMACGIPCIVPETGGASSNFKNNDSGLTYRPNDKNQLIKKIGMLLTNQRFLSKISSNAQKSVRDWSESTSLLMKEIKGIRNE